MSQEGTIIRYENAAMQSRKDEVDYIKTKRGIKKLSRMKHIIIITTIHLDIEYCTYQLRRKDMLMWRKDEEGRMW